MILKAEWKSQFKANFYDAYKTATDYGACCLITPYLDFQKSSLFENMITIEKERVSIRN